MQQSDKLLDIYIYEFYLALDCPRSLTCWLLWKHNEHQQLAQIQFDPLSYESTTDAEDSLAATKFLSKADFLKTGYDLQAVALEKFLGCEQHCKMTNHLITLNRFSNGYTASILERARHVVSAILGRFVPEDWVDSCNWGPGSTFEMKRRFASAPNKFDVERQITADAYLFVKDFWTVVYPNWDIPMFEIINGCKVITVPKDAKTDRVIAVEPGINLWFQKGIGALIRKRLRYSGIDLNSQDHNQRLSRMASKFNNLATVDFSSASDTISKGIVKELLPKEWFSVLEAFRSKFGLLDGKWFQFEKFSSMGNGFTFELESLIFFALSVASCDQLGLEDPTISVYGDDVILPSSAYDLFSSVCVDLGFTVNKQKSYSTGYYRESCGEHHWRGHRVKPIFQKEKLNGKTSVLKAANSVRRLAHRRNYYGCDYAFRRCWQTLADYLGPKKPYISEGYGDVGLIENFDESRSNIRSPLGGVEGNLVSVYAIVAVSCEFDSRGLLLSKLKSFGSSRPDHLVRDLTDIRDVCSGGNLVPLPGQVRYARKRILVLRWYDLGPWV